MPNENEVTLSLALDDQVSPALANVEAGYLAALAQTQAAPTVTVNDLATPTLRAIRAELAALSGELMVVTQQAAAQAVSYSVAPAQATIDRATVRQVIIPELNRLGYRA